MNFSCSVEINVQRDFMVELMAEKNNFPHWQPEFRSVESVDGTPGQSGTKTLMKYQSGKHNFELIETIRTNNLPDEIIGEYETPGTCWNTMHSVFSSLAENRTLWETEIEYKFHGFMIKVMAKIMPGMFRKQTQKYLDNFKAFAEERFANQS